MLDPEDYLYRLMNGGIVIDELDDDAFDSDDDFDLFPDESEGELCGISSGTAEDPFVQYAAVCAERMMSDSEADAVGVGEAFARMSRGTSGRLDSPDVIAAWDAMCARGAGMTVFQDLNERASAMDYARMVDLLPQSEKYPRVSSSAHEKEGAGYQLYISYPTFGMWGARLHHTNGTAGLVRDDTSQTLQDCGDEMDTGEQVQSPTIGLWSTFRAEHINGSTGVVKGMKAELGLM